MWRFLSNLFMRVVVNPKTTGVGILAGIPGVPLIIEGWTNKDWIKFAMGISSIIGFIAGLAIEDKKNVK